MDYGLSVFYNNGKNYTLVGDGIVREYPVGGLICEYCRLVPTELKDIILDCPGLDLEANPDTDRRHLPWDDILFDEREKVGPRSLRNMIFPWK